jgi:hypothetical protein
MCSTVGAAQKKDKTMCSRYQGEVCRSSTRRGSRQRKSCAGKSRLRRVSCMKEALGNLSDACKDALAEAVGRK